MCRLIEIIKMKPVKNIRITVRRTNRCSKLIIHFPLSCYMIMNPL